MTVTSVMVLASGIVLLYKPWYWLEPALSFVITAYILKNCWKLLRKTTRILMNTTPPWILTEWNQRENHCFRLSEWGSLSASLEYQLLTCCLFLSYCRGWHSDKPYWRPWSTNLPCTPANFQYQSCDPTVWDTCLWEWVLTLRSWFVMSKLLFLCNKIAPNWVGSNTKDIMSRT